MAQLQQQFSQIDKAVKEVDEKIADFEIERSAGPVDRPRGAQPGQHGPGDRSLAEAERNLVSTAVVKPRLVDLYCNTGQPEKAYELLAPVPLEDPNLGVGAGLGAFRQGRVYFLLGNYLSAATLWHERAIPRVRADRSGRVLAAATGLTRGDAMQTTNAFLALPDVVGAAGDAGSTTWACASSRPACPSAAAESLTKALTLAPDLGVRLIAAYYLEKMGKPVPPPAKSDSRSGCGCHTACWMRSRPTSLGHRVIGQPAATTKPAADKPTISTPEPAKDKPTATPPGGAGADRFQEERIVKIAPSRN